MSNAETTIALLAQADRAIAEATNVADAVRLAHDGKAMREWASAVHAGQDTERTVGVFVLRAMRNAGQRIAEAQERGEVARPADGVRFSALVADDDKLPATLMDIGVTRDESSDWKRLAQNFTDDEVRDLAGQMRRPSLAALMTSDSPEWYTPPEVVEAVVLALGAIDLDPCAESARRIPAAAHYTVDDDGLEQGWRGRVYMNPPYGREIGDWVDKLVMEYEAGNVTEAVALVPGRIDTAWYRRIASVACHVTGRLRFSGADPAPFPSVALYLGPNVDSFCAAFDGLGDIWRKVA